MNFIMTKNKNIKIIKNIYKNYKIKYKSRKN